MVSLHIQQKRKNKNQNKKNEKIILKLGEGFHEWTLRAAYGPRVIVWGNLL